uniref:BTB domain-containing protein n=1 Tax=Parascaris univalens TaxID=6257 RepID=A0A914ZXH7_PARUN
CWCRTAAFRRAPVVHEISGALINTGTSMYALDDTTHLAIPRDSVLAELTFIYRFSFLIKEGASIWNFCCGRFRTAYGTRAVNWSVQTDGAVIEVRSFDSLDKLPEGKYRLSLNATSRDGAQEVASCITFVDRSCDIEGTPFQKAMTRLTAGKSIFIGGEACINVELTFPAEEFVDPKPNYILPEIPSHLASNDYRIVMTEKASKINDFTIETLSGFIRTVRLLLMLSTRYFRDFITLNPCCCTATLPFKKETVSEVLKFAFTGSFDLADADVDILDEFLSCVELVLPTNTRSLIEHISLTLRRRVNKEWQILTLHEVLRLLVLSCKHALWDLSCTMTNLVANVHYKVFLRDYNAHSTGENLQLYRQLREQTFRFVHPLENMRRKYEQSARMRPILRFSSSNNADEFIS